METISTNTLSITGDLVVTGDIINFSAPPRKKKDVIIGAIYKSAISGELYTVDSVHIGNLFRITWLGITNSRAEASNHVYEDDELISSGK